MSRTSDAYERLKRSLLDGVYAPRSKLRIDQIAETLEVSTGAVREALSRLTSDGLVVAEPQRGFMATPITTDDLIDLTSVRIEIDTKCLRRSIQFGDLAWEGRIMGIWHEFSHTSPIARAGGAKIDARWSELHGEFHDVLVSACNSRWRLRLRDQLYLQAERYRRMLLPYAKMERDAHAEHQAIVDATLARDADRAATLLAEHLQLTADILLGSDAPFDDAPHVTRESVKSV